MLWQLDGIVGDQSHLIQYLHQNESIVNAPRRPCMIPFRFRLALLGMIWLHFPLFHRGARLRSALVNYFLRRNYSHRKIRANVAVILKNVEVVGESVADRR